MKKFWVILIIIVVAILLLYFLSTIILNQKMNQTLSSLKNSGFATTILEIKPKPTDQGKKAAELLTNAYNGIKRESRKGFDAEAQEREIADSIDYSENPALFKKIVKDNQKEIDLLLSAALYPNADFDFKYEDGLAAKIPEPTGNLHNFCRLLRIYAKTLAGEGKTDAALQVLTRAIHLSFILSDNMLLFHLIQALALSKTLDVVQTIAPKGSVAALESLAVEIEKINVNSSLTKATEVEMIMWQYVFSSGKKLQDNILGSGMLLTPRQHFLLFLTGLAPVKKYAQLRLLNLMKKEILLTRLPYYQTEKDWDAFETSMKKPSAFNSLEMLFIPNLKVFVTRTTNLEAKRNVTLLGLKTLIQKKKTGKLPKTLNEAVAQAPADPFSGNEFIYKALPNGCLIYSVGRDGTDDSGDAKKDIVWKVLI